VPAEYPDEVLSRIAPIGYKHINLRGILTFDLTRLARACSDARPSPPKNVHRADKSRVYIDFNGLRHRLSHNPQAVAAYRGEPAGVFEIAEGDAIGCGRALQMLDLRELYLFDLAGSSVGLARTCARRRWWRGSV